MNNSPILNNIPSSNRDPFGYKSINSSSIHNENQKEVREDIIDLFNKYNAIERVNVYQNSVTRIENDYIKSVLNYLRQKVDNLEAFLGTLSPNTNPKAYNIYADSMVTQNDYHSIIDSKTGVVLAEPIKRVSKCALFDVNTDSVFLPKGLNVNIVNSIGRTISDVDNDVYSPFTLKEDLYWIRHSIVGLGESEIGCDYIITLPEEIMTTNDINEIIVNPFNAVIKDVAVRYGDSSSWESVNYSSAISNDSSILKHNKTARIIFPKKRANQIKITVATSIFNDITYNSKTATYGIKSISAYINDYDDFVGSTFEAYVSIPTNIQISLTNIIPSYENKNMQYKDFSFEIFEKNVLGEYVKITKDFPILPNSNDLKLVCRFARTNKESAINKVTLVYNV